MNRLSFAKIAGLCMASFTLAMHARAQVANTTDSLGLQVLNSLLTVVPGELTIDVTLGDLRRIAPGMKKISLGPEHAIWGKSRKTDQLSYEIVYPADSGTFLARVISQNARIASINVYYGSDSADSVLAKTTAYYAAASRVGQPDFCERDTVLKEGGNTVVVFVDAGWVRGDARVLFEATYDLRFEPFALRWRFPRFSLAYRAFRNSDFLIRRSLPERHDSPCFLTESEILGFRTPLDSTSYAALRATLLARPTQPVRRPI